MTVQKLGDKLQDIAHAGDSLSRVYIQKGDKLKEIQAVEIIDDLNIKIIVLKEEE